MTEADLRQKLEELEVDPKKIDEFVDAYDFSDEKIKVTATPGVLAPDKISELQLALDKIPKKDQIKRAQVSARIISAGLGE